MKKLKFLLALALTLPAWSQAVSPPDQAWTTSLRPTISADYDTRVSGARIWVDGKEFTSYARTRGDTVTLTPPYNLDYGRHRVQLMTSNGHQTNWSFNIVRNDQANVPNQDPYYYPNTDPYYPTSNPNSYPTNNDPYNYPTNNDPNSNPDDGGFDIEDILPSLIRLIPNR